MLLDFFRIQDMQETNIEDMQRVMVFTCKGINEPIEVRHLECKEITETLVKKNAVPFSEVGPSFSMRVRRDKMATVDLFKEACRKPKITNVVKKRQDKNKYTNEIGETKGKVYVQNQDLATLTVRKYGPKKAKRDSKPTAAAVVATDL